MQGVAHLADPLPILQWQLVLEGVHAGLDPVLVRYLAPEVDRRRQHLRPQAEEQRLPGRH